MENSCLLGERGFQGVYRVWGVVRPPSQPWLARVLDKLELVISLGLLESDGVGICECIKCMFKLLVKCCDHSVNLKQKKNVENKNPVLTSLLPFPSIPSF